MELKPLKATELQPPLNVTLIQDEAGLDKLDDFFNRCGGIVGWDIETDPKKDFFWRRIRTIQFGNTQEQYVIDLLPFFDNNSDLLFKLQGSYGIHLPERVRALMSRLKRVLCSKEHLKVGVNLSFEYQNFYWLLGLRAFNFFCCSITERCIWAGAHSLKDYSFYSMDEMMQRYFGVQIDKTLQESFTMDQPLTWDQVLYAALDTRFPLSLRSVQMLILNGETVQSLQKKGLMSWKYLKNIDAVLEDEFSNLITGDNLTEIAKIENDAIGAFEDMHVHGERLDRPRWLQRVAARRADLKTLIRDRLDPVFLPIVGSKHDMPSDQQLAAAEATWKELNKVRPDELRLAKEWRLAKKSTETQAAFEEQFTGVLQTKTGEKRVLKAEIVRKAEKEKLKAHHAELKRRRSAINKLAAKCEGEALINYGSPTQVINVLKGMKGLAGLEDTDDDSLEEYSHIPAVEAFREYRTLTKEIKTYGDQWVQEWKIKPSKKEGWLHPGDGRLHCVFNQYDAETGRSTSEKPNGQNLPRDKEVRNCFVVDPPDEDEPEGYVMVTADMSGAELRILADLANEPVWVSAFNRGEDVHCICVELMDDEAWKPLAQPGCLYYELRPDGTPLHKACKCEAHKTLRNDMKPMNFGIPYGISAPALSKQIKKPVAVIEERLDKHKANFARLWAYVDASGKDAQMLKKSFDMFGRRRLFPEPTWDRAKQKAMADYADDLEYEEDVQELNKANFIALNGRKPTKEEQWLLFHRLPSNKQIGRAFKAMHGSIERQGKNHPIQGTNATIAKLAMGSGYCPDGKPYLWHTLPQYKAKLLKFVHDELVVQCPKRYGQKVADLIGDAFKRAAAEKMKRVVMEFEFNIAAYWMK